MVDHAPSGTEIKGSVHSIKNQTFESKVAENEATVKSSTSAKGLGHTPSQLTFDYFSSARKDQLQKRMDFVILKFICISGVSLHILELDIFKELL